MNVLLLGDIVGKPGREIIAKALPKLKEKGKIDFVIANAENSAGGSGITVSVAQELFDLGCNVLTSGDHIWKKKEVLEIIDNPYILRPANYPPNSPGKGFNIYRVDTKQGAFDIAVVNLQGRVFMSPIECPFRTAGEILSKIKEKTKLILVDIHAEATSEKIALGFYLDGKVSAVVGTHTHVQTADEKILHGGTAYITDLGMTGAHDSVIGRKKENVIERFISGLPVRFELATDDLRLEGVVVDIDNDTGKARSIKRIVETCEIK